ncbi:MAG: SRPBCC family protein [Dechloromonas sp.]|nr:SRPBCC family protein [Dechloromonas sp.]
MIRILTSAALCFAAFLFVLPDSVHAAATPTLIDDDVEVSFDQGTYFGHLNFLLPVPPGVAWEVLTDFDQMARFIPNLEESRVLNRDAQGATIAQKGRIRYGILSFAFESERRVEFHPQEGLLLARALSGTARHMASTLRLQAEGTGTRLDYRVEMIPGRWVPSSLGKSGMRHEMAEQFSAIAVEMLRRAERAAPPH